MSRRRVFALAAVLALAPALALAREEATGAADPEGPPTEAEAIRGEGFEGRPPDEPPGSVLGGLLAAVPGFFVHGIGHYYVGEERTALTLLLAEGVGVALVVAGALLGEVTDESGELAGPRRALTHGGVLLFAGSWIADILGASKGAESFEPDTSRTDGTVFGLAYRYTNDPLTPFRHHAVLRLNIDRGTFYLRPLADFEAGLDTRRLQLDVGGRVLRSEDRHSFFAVGGRFVRVETPQFGFATRTFEGYLQWKLELGQFMRSLRNLYLVNRTGAGYTSWQFADRLDRAPSLLSDAHFSQAHLVLESGMELNTGRRTHLAVLFVQDPTRDIARASTSTGLIEAGLVHRYHEDLDIEATLTGGDGWALWLGVAYGF